MYHLLKLLVLHAARCVGLFRLCRKLTRRHLRILCYHGISMRDEHEWQPGLFLSAALFRARLDWLRRHGFRVLRLGDAVESLYADRLPDDATVITFDDGWSGTWKHGGPALAEHGFPATIYVTTYYAGKKIPVYNVAVRYLFWRTQTASLDLSAVGEGLEGGYDLTDPARKAQAREKVVEHGDDHLDAPGKQDLLRRLGGLLGLDIDALLQERICALMTFDEVAEAVEAGIDIQLHTHRHHLAFEDRGQVEREITDNRDALEPIVRRSLDHLCYPNGDYHPRIWPWLSGLGVRSATTTRAGFNTPRSHPLELHRFLDGEHIRWIEFEAEMCGVLELLRRLRARLRRRR